MKKVIDRRLLIRAITYRILVTACTVPVTGWTIALWLALMATIIYYIHEKVWEIYL